MWVRVPPAAPWSVMKKYGPFVKRLIIEKAATDATNEAAKKMESDQENPFSLVAQMALDIANGNLSENLKSAERWAMNMIDFARAQGTLGTDEEIAKTFIDEIRVHNSTR